MTTVCQMCLDSNFSIMQTKNCRELVLLFALQNRYPKVTIEMKWRNRIVLLILVMLLFAGPGAWVAASGSGDSGPAHSIGQTAVLSLLNHLAKPACLPADKLFQQIDFDMTQPVPDCWLLSKSRTFVK